MAITMRRRALLVMKSGNNTGYLREYNLRFLVRSKRRLVFCWKYKWVPICVLLYKSKRLWRISIVVTKLHNDGAHVCLLSVINLRVCDSWPLRIWYESRSSGQRSVVHQPYIFCLALITSQKLRIIIMLQCLHYYFC